MRSLIKIVHKQVSNTYNPKPEQTSRTLFFLLDICFLIKLPWCSPLSHYDLKCFVVLSQQDMTGEPEFFTLVVTALSESKYCSFKSSFEFKRVETYPTQDYTKDDPIQ